MLHLSIKLITDIQRYTNTNYPCHNFSPFQTQRLVITFTYPCTIHITFYIIINAKTILYNTSNSQMENSQKYYENQIKFVAQTLILNHISIICYLHPLIFPVNKKIQEISNDYTNQNFQLMVNSTTFLV